MSRFVFGIALVCVSGLGCRRPTESAPKTTIEVRRAETEPGEGLTEATVENQGGGSRTVYLHSKAEITSEDIAEMRVDATGKMILSRNIPGLLMLWLTEAGTKKMEKLSTEH